MSNSDFEATVNNKVAVKTTKTNKETNVKKTYTHSDGSTFEYTSISELKDIREMLAELERQTIVTTAVKGPRQGTKPEDCLTHKGLTLVQNGVNGLFNWVTPKADAVNIFVADDLVPTTLEMVSSSAGKVEGLFGSIKTRTADKAKALRVDASVEDKAAAFAKKLEKMVASDPQGAVMYQAMQMAKA